MKSVASMFQEATSGLLPEENPSFAPLAKGEYEVVVQRSEIRQTKTGNGVMLAVGMTHNKRWVWDNILVQHPNPDAQRIGKQRMARLLHAAGIGIQQLAENSGILQGKSMRVYLTVDRDGENAVRDYLPSESAPSDHSEMPDEEIPF